MRHFVGAAALPLGLMLAGAPAGAWATDWIVTVGGRVAASPPYEGANHDNVRPSLLFSVRRADRPYRFTPPDDGGSLALFASKHFDFGPVLFFRYSRSDTGALKGFDKIGFAVEPGVFVNLWATDWLRARVQIRQGVLGHHGAVGDAGIDLIRTGRKWDASIGPRVGYGDARYMDTYFGVTPLEARRSPLLNTAYEPGAGVRNIGVETAFAYHWTNRLRTVVDVGYHRLAHAAADSPVVAIAGSRDQFSAGVGLTYSFGVGLGHRN
ncbi:MAG TPA: MipA/OmpV family protein [Caulobacteraceae bacterium]|jgi:outer membrane scaffolding protein for murein synthesis (MipA/OmpV family)